MSYYFTRMLDMAFDDAIAKVTDELKKAGFGVLTEIDVRATLKKKLDVDFRPYRILGPAIRRSPTRPCWPKTRSARCCPAM